MPAFVRYHFISRLRLLPSSTLAACISLAILVSACDSGSDDDGAAFLDHDGMKAEYIAKVHSYQFPLPQGVSFPAEPPRPSVETRFERGNGIIQADNFWRCAWMYEWLDARDAGGNRADTAMSWLERFSESEFMRKYVDPPGDPNWSNNVLGPAKLGDLTNFMALLQSCPATARSPGIS